MTNRQNNRAPVRVLLWTSFIVVDTDSDETRYVVQEILSPLDPARHKDISFQREEWDGRRPLFVAVKADDGRILLRADIGAYDRLVHGLKKRGIRHAYKIAYADRNITPTEADATVPVDYLNGASFDIIQLPDGRTADYRYQRRAIYTAIMQKRGIINAATNCHAIGQLVLMYDGTLRKIEDVRVGDMLMGPDSTPRIVLKTHRGVGPLVRVTPNKYDSFVVTRDHVLTLVNNDKRFDDYGVLKDVPVSEWFSWCNTRKHTHKLVRTGVEFQNTLPTGSLDPYFIGLMLGDGCMSRDSCVCVANSSSVIRTYLADYAATYGLVLREHEHPRTGAWTSYLSHQRRGGENIILSRLRDLGLSGCSAGDKFIPDRYRRAARAVRLQLLAGLMDTDGHVSGPGTYDYVTKSRKLAEDVSYVARSLGFRAVFHSRQSTWQGGTGEYWRVSLSGAVHEIPCRVRPATATKSKRSALRDGFTVSEIGDGEYAGVTVDGDHRYMLDDFTVTHNSGKTNIMAAVALRLQELYDTKTLVMVPQSHLLHQTAGVLAQKTGLTVGMMGDSLRCDPDQCEIIVATAATMWSVRKRNHGLYRSIVDGVDCLILDEAHHARANTWTQVTRECAAQFRLLVTGTVPREDTLRAAKLKSICGRVIFRVGNKGLIERGVSADVDIFVYHDKSWSPKDLGGCRVQRPETCDVLLYTLEDGTLYTKPAKYYSQRMAAPSADGDDPGAVIVVGEGKGRLRYRTSQSGPFLTPTVYDCGIQNYDPRNRAITAFTLLCADLHRPNLVIVNNMLHLTILSAWFIANGVNFRTAHGSIKIADRIEMLESLAEGEIDCVLSSVVMDEGIDVPAIGAVTLGAGGKSEIRLFQRIGRGIRRKQDGSKLWVFLPYDGHHGALSRHSDNTIRLLRKDQLQIRQATPKHLKKYLARVQAPEVIHEDG